MTLRLSSLLSMVGLLTSCMRWSPFETELSADERDKTAENLARLAERPEPPPRYRIGLLADSHNRFEELAEVVDELVLRDDLELVVFLGDLSSLGLREEYRWSLEQLERLDVPYLTVIGNHDALSNGKTLYREMFGPYDYTVTHGGVSLVLFNSNRLEFGKGVPDLDWLDASTRSAPGESVVAFTHQRPEHAPAIYDAVLVDNGVEFLATGHLHSGLGAFEVDGMSGFGVGAVKSLDYAILSVGDGPPEIESCHRHSCVPVSE